MKILLFFLAVISSSHSIAFDGEIFAGCKSYPKPQTGSYTSIYLENGTKTIEQVVQFDTGDILESLSACESQAEAINKALSELQAK